MASPQRSTPLHHPSPLRSLFAVLFGFVLMIVAVIPMTLIAVKSFGPPVTGHPNPRYLLYNVFASLVTAFIGGFVTACMAPNRRQRHGIVLALVLLVMTAISYTHYHGAQPVWYQLLMLALPPASVVLAATLVDRYHRTRMSPR
jgi:peptidoglycan/LPS O-acetylase OafA/YrhL